MEMNANQKKYFLDRVERLSKSKALAALNHNEERYMDRKTLKGHTDALELLDKLRRIDG